MTSLGEQFNELVEVSLQAEEIQSNLKENMMIHKTAKSNKNIGKKYMTTRIKSRNFLSNIAYIGISKEDYYNENFAFDVYLLLTKNLNPFSLDRKLVDKTKHEMIYML